MVMEDLNQLCCQMARTGIAVTEDDGLTAELLTALPELEQPHQIQAVAEPNLLDINLRQTAIRSLDSTMISADQQHPAELFIPATKF